MNQAPKKVLFLITKGTWGGAQKYVFDLATHLPKERFEPVVAYGTRGKLANDLTTAGIATFQLPSLGRDIAMRSDLRSFFEILRCLRAERFGVLHLNSSKAAALGALAGRLSGVKKIIFTVHGWPFLEPRNALSRSIIWFFSWFTALCSTNIICISDFDLQQAQQMPFIGRRAVRIYNGIDLHMQFGSGDVVRSYFPVGATITGTIGELTKNKNQVSLIERAKKDPSMHIALVGDGELKDFLGQKIAEYKLQARVKLLGFIPAKDALKGFDVFTLPSIKEGLPYVLLEAKLAGLPIEANRVGGVGEILDTDISEFSLEKMLKRTAALYLAE